MDITKAFKFMISMCSWIFFTKLCFGRLGIEPTKDKNIKIKIAFIILGVM